MLSGGQPAAGCLGSRFPRPRGGQPVSQGPSALLLLLLAGAELGPGRPCTPTALTLFRGESARTGSSAARAMLLSAMTTRMTISKYRMVTM